MANTLNQTTHLRFSVSGDPRPQQRTRYAVNRYGRIHAYNPDSRRMRLLRHILRFILNMPVGNSPIFDSGAFLKITVMFQLRRPPPTMWETGLLVLHPTSPPPQTLTILSSSSLMQLRESYSLKTTMLLPFMPSRHMPTLTVLVRLVFSLIASSH
eukprot:15365303-Ditylum_brightwellii.AAC.3